jgi:hypothetical protein
MQFIQTHKYVFFWTPYNQHVNNLYQQDSTPAVWRRLLKAHSELEAELVAKFSLAEFWPAKSPGDIETSFDAILERKKMEPVSPEKTQGKRQSGDDAEVPAPKTPRIALPAKEIHTTTVVNPFKDSQRLYSEPALHTTPATSSFPTVYILSTPTTTGDFFTETSFCRPAAVSNITADGIWQLTKYNTKSMGKCSINGTLRQPITDPKRNGGRGTNIPACFRCTLKGHYANDCSEQKSQVAGFEIGASYEDNIWKFKGIPFCMRYQSGSCGGAVSCHRAHICSFLLVGEVGRPYAL